MAITTDTLGTPVTGEAGTFTMDASASASDSLTLPGGLNPATADFAHEGPDLVMTWPDGSEITVTDYFTVDPQPNLTSGEGAQVGADLAARLSGPMAPGMVAAVGDGVAEQPIGQVDKMDGTVTAIRADGTKVELKIGDSVYQGDILETSADGALGVILADETTFSMAEDGRMILDEMVYDPGTQEGSVSLSVMHGVFTFVSGQVAKSDPDAMTLNTPVATIGIRGTQVGLDITDGQNLKVALMEEADGFVGEVVVLNDGGVSVLNGANEFTTVSNFNGSPSETITINNYEMINTFSSSLRHLPLQNSNVNDYGLQGNTLQDGASADGLADFETAAGGGDAAAAGLNDMTTAAGGADNAGNPYADFDAAGGNTINDAAATANFETAAGGTGTNVTGASASILGAVGNIAEAIAPISPVVTAAGSALTGGATVVNPTTAPTTSTPVPTPDATPTPTPTPVGSVEVTAVNATGQEDGTFSLDIGVTATNTTVDTITVSGVPTGTTLSAGTDNHDGTWTLSSGDLTGLTITPTADFAGTFNLSVTATPVSGDPASATSVVDVTPVADAPTLTINPSAGLEDTPIDLNVSTAATDTDGSEVLSVTIGGVPAGATLSAGTDNGDGTWTLTPDQLTGLQLNPVANFNGSVNLTVTSTSTDTLGNITDSATTTGNLTVSIAPVGDTPDITLQPATGAEDGTVPLNIGATATGGETIASVTVSGVPSGATLSAGTDNGDGTWTLTSNDLTGLTMSPPADFAGAFNLAVTATSSEGGVNSANMGVNVTPVADAPTLTATASTGAEDTAISLNVASALTDTDGSETLSVTISGVPTGASLSAGTDNGDGTWTMTPGQLTGLSMTPPANFNGDIKLGVVSTSTDTLGNVTDTASTSGSLTVSVTAVADAPTLAVTNATGGEDAAGIPLSISAVGTGGVPVTGVTVSGIPAGASLSAGTDNGDGTWTLSPAQLTGLSVKPAADFAGTYNLNVTATSADGSTSSGALNVNVTPVADAPTLTATASTGAEDTAISLNVASALTDTDGSETLSVTISGVPTGASLSAGTDNGDGTWTMTPGQLTGLSMTPPANFNGDIKLGVVSTSTDTLGNVTDTASTSGSLTVSVTAVADAPTLAVTNATGGEDAAGIPLSISAVGTGGVPVTGVTVSGIPAGASLSAGTDNGDGTWTLTPAQLTGLSVKPAADFAGTYSLNVTATSADGSTSSGALSVNVTPVADAPTLTINPSTGAEDTAIALNVASALTDTDGSETLSVTISGVPTGATLSAGTDNGDGTWTMTPGQLTGLSMTPPANFNGDIKLGVVSTSTDTLGNVTDTASTSGDIVVHVTSVPDAPTLTLANSQGQEDASGIPLSISAAGIHGVDVTGIIVTNIPHGVSLSAGTDNGDGTWTLTPAQLTGLSVKPAADFAGTYSFGVTATSADGSTTSGNFDVLVNPVADAPSLNLGTSTGAEDTAIALNVASALTDTDGSETLSVTISGVPTGATLSAGTDNGDGTWTMTPGQLTGLSMTPPANFNGDIKLGVVSTSTETLGNVTDTASTSGSLTVSVTPVPDAPVVGAGNVGGNEDTAIALDITATATNNVAVTSVTINSVPTGATLSAGTDNHDGTWTLTPDQLSGLTVTPPNDYSGSFNLGVTATSADGSTTTATTTVSVDAVADAPSLTTGIGGSVASGVSADDYDNIKFGKDAGKDAGKDSVEDHGSRKGEDMVGGKGNDYADGEKGNDMLAGKDGADEIEGGGGKDLLFGGSGDDEVQGDSGDDILFGGSGNNKLEGGSGDDIIVGGSGNDKIEGGSGDDVIVSGGGNDKVDGGSGTDTMVFSGARSDYRVTQVDGHSDKFVVEHLNGGSDGTNLVSHVETFQFSDGQFSDNNMLASNPPNYDSLTYDITIDTGLSDTDGSESLSDVTVSGIPHGASFSAGTDNGDGSWTMAPNDLNGLTLNVDNSVGKDFSLNVSVTSTEASNGSASTTTSSIDVALPDDASTDITGDTSVDALDPLSTMFSNSDTLTFEGKEYDISSLTEGDSNNNYGDVAPLGAKHEVEGYDASNNDASDGYSSTTDVANANPLDDSGQNNS